MPTNISARHSVVILWSSDPEGYAQVPTRYVFSTEGELRAFLLGADESNGWMEYEIVDDDDLDPATVAQYADTTETAEEWFDREVSFTVDRHEMTDAVRADVLAILGESPGDEEYRKAAEFLAVPQEAGR